MLKKRRYLKTSEITKRRRRIFGYKIAAAVVLFFVVLFGLSYLSGMQSMTIQNVTVVGNAQTRADVIEGVARDALKGEYLSLFSKQNFLLYPEDTVRQNVLDRYARLSEVKIAREGFQNLVINVTERDPKYLWCGFKQLSQGGQNDVVAAGQKESGLSSCYFLDDAGYIFGKAPNFSGGSYVEFSGPLLENSQDLAVEPNPENIIQTAADSQQVIGRHYLNKEAFMFVYDVIEGVEGFDVSVTKASWNGFNDMTLVTDYGFHVLFRFDGEPKEIIENLKAVLSSEVFQGPEGQEELEKVRYFDLRFGDRVFYK